MKSSIRMLLLILVMAYSTLGYAVCTPGAGCGPDQNMPRTDYAFYTFTVPEGNIGKIDFGSNAECEQAVVFYRASDWERIGRLGTHENDDAGTALRTHGLPAGTYHVGGYMKYNGRWRNSTAKELARDSTHVKAGWDDNGCRGHDPDNDFDDVSIVVTFQRVRSRR